MRLKLPLCLFMAAVGLMLLSQTAFATPTRPVNTIVTNQIDRDVTGDINLLDEEAAFIPMAQAPQPSKAITLTRIGVYETKKDGGAEIVTYDPISSVMYITNGEDNAIDAVDISTPTKPTLIRQIALADYGGGVNSTAFYSYGTAATEGFLAVAVQANVKQDNGSIVFFDRDGNKVAQITAGALPDMVTFTPDGSKVVAANEGEPNGEYTVDPEGSVTVIDVSGGVASVTQTNVTNVGFTEFNVGGPRYSEIQSSTLRIFGPNASVAQDLEPEYIGVSDDSSKAYVTLQENNGLAVINLSTNKVEAIVPLGFKDHSVAGNGLDASDKDGGINIKTYPFKGVYQPDSIAAFTVNNKTYLVTANEGDGREYEFKDKDGKKQISYTDENRLGDVTIDPALGVTVTRTKISTATVLSPTAQADSDGDGDLDNLYTFGARSFSVWGAAGNLVYDSGDDFEEIIAQQAPAMFVDKRSDDKGPEPEAATVGEVNGKIYAFIGLERSGGIMVYDVSTPASPVFVQFVTAGYENKLDISPEGFKFVSADKSPNGKPLLLVANEISGSTAVFQIDGGSQASAAVTLTLLHNNDGESTLAPLFYNVGKDIKVPVSGVSAYKAVLDREMAEAKAAGNTVLNVYAGDAFLASAALQCSLPITSDKPVLDSVAQSLMPYDAHILGNHEFDYTPDFLLRFIKGFAGADGMLTHPFLSGNLDFSKATNYADLIDEDGVYDATTETGRVIAQSAIIIKDGQKFGIVSAVTPLLPTISSPDPVALTTKDVAETVTLLQQQIDALKAKGVNKIILVSHLQNLEVDKTEVVPNLTGVDIAVGGGGDELLVNQTISQTVPITRQMLPSERSKIAGNYPELVKDKDGKDVYVVTTAGNYKYAGRLDVQFDADGNITNVIQEKSYPRRVIPVSAVATTLGVPDAVAQDAMLETNVVSPLQACLSDFGSTTVATTTVVLDVSKGTVRGAESNAGNLITDGYLYALKKFAPFNNDVSAPDNRTIAVQNGGGIRQNAGDELPQGGQVPGPITLLDTLNVLAFTTNKLTVIKDVSPAEVKQIFERSVSRVGGGQFLQVSGVKVVYDPNGAAQVLGNARQVLTAGNRIMSVVLNDGTAIVQDGQVLTNAPSITITTNSYTADGGDNYVWFKNSTNKVNVRDEVGTFIGYDAAWRTYLEDPTADGGLGRAIPNRKAYQKGGEGRIQVASDSSTFLPVILSKNGTQE